MEPYFRIGEISSIFNIPLQTLRYYDKIGLFSPVHTNQETGYRYYNLHQLPLLHQIKTFKSMEIPFSEIKELTSTDWNVDKMDQVYALHLERLEQKMRELQTLKTELEAKRHHFLALQAQPKNQISIRQCGAREIFCKPIDVSTYKEQETEYYRSFLPFSNQIDYIHVEPGFIVTRPAFFNERTKASYLFLVNPTVVPEGFQSHHMTEGTYLTLLIEDSYAQSPSYYSLLRQHILNQGIEIVSDIYEFCYTVLPNDNNDISVWELQVQINPLTLPSL
ncbi:MerR family transcriptional regulator [Paenibacillus apiarius]|uniref:MerR family transcriptional regulator n=1 Tax=Paenibacillus apiarius TaxID=46240 RepID=A0ABT4DYQ8_9BACL|nr:MerR family transcriptional regulator [Paenibacillus apiarius]MCY9513491.1 MerR family transcriptional regulator [Paenibacillus apiarius]MCY9521218.1 MerR family transcriptional regulator [Paenibacillus apiarius]MCY9553407.1 MerR family transcriptional regulator [Paenibacillus apiarius]MCY9559559.1 MerR family transcriptional regulator [Paenibacillus apiarius]MCY9685436.1 MerR family transcriptional regulator [Paenibacillus apiarius]